MDCRAFPPNSTSLGDDLAGLVSWRRPSDLSGETSHLSPTCDSLAYRGYGKPFPSDVRPCSFAVDASLSCGIAALAELPALVSSALCNRVESMCHLGVGCDEVNTSARRATHVERAFAAAVTNTTETAKAGLFCARLCVHGVWKEYILDSLFPCFHSRAERRGGDSITDGESGLCLSSAHGRALWVSMLEKAYARAVGSYTVALGGCCFLPNPAVRDAKKRSEEGEGHDGGHPLQLPACTARKAAQERGKAWSAIARPAQVLSMFTGSPFLQMEISGRNGRGPEEHEEHERSSSEELWRSIVRDVFLSTSGITSSGAALHALISVAVKFRVQDLTTSRPHLVRKRMWTARCWRAVRNRQDTASRCFNLSQQRQGERLVIEASVLHVSLVTALLPPSRVHLNILPHRRRQVGWIEEGWLVCLSTPPSGQEPKRDYDQSGCDGSWQVGDVRNEVGERCGEN